MKCIFTIIMICSLLAASPILAGDEEYNDCILEHLKDAKVNSAAQLIKNACKENYGDFMFLSKKQQTYNECLLEHLVGIESSDAAIEIERVCSNKYLKF